MSQINPNSLTTGSPNTPQVLYDNTVHEKTQRIAQQSIPQQQVPDDSDDEFFDCEDGSSTHTVSTTTPKKDVSAEIEQLVYLIEYNKLVLQERNPPKRPHESFEQYLTRGAGLAQLQAKARLDIVSNIGKLKQLDPHYNLKSLGLDTATLLYQNF